ncbi:hypothetical protein BC829DRAFT_256345 [Chytridium lagenaria]|nr:hypothetical protein BC829DRAFT_256345 [Chytridium lagenaria]
MFLCRTTRVKLGIKEPNYLGAYREIEVIEHAPCHLAPTFTSSPSLTAETCVEVGGWMRSSRGEVTLRAECHVPDAGQESGTVAGSWVAGGIAFVTVNIQNASKRKIRSIKLALVRRLKTFVRAEAPTQTSSSLDSVDDTTSDAPVLSPVHFSRRIVAEKEFLSGRSERSSAVSVYAKPSGSWTEDVGGSNIVKWNGWWHGIKPSEKRRMMLDIFVPIHTRSIRFGITVDVSYVLQVSATPRGCPPVVVEIPVTVLHPASLLTSLPRLIAPVCKESPIVSSVVKVRTETSEAIEEDGVFHASSLVASGTIKSMESDGAKSSGKLVPSLVEGQTGYDIVDVTEFPLDDEPILSRHTTIFPTNHTGSTLESYSPRRPSTSDSLSSLSRTGTVVIKQTETPSRHVTLDRHRTIITQSTPQFTIFHQRPI